MLNVEFNLTQGYDGCYKNMKHLKIVVEKKLFILQKMM